MDNKKKDNITNKLYFFFRILTEYKPKYRTPNIITGPLSPTKIEKTTCHKTIIEIGSPIKEIYFLKLEIFSVKKIAL